MVAYPALQRYRSGFVLIKNVVGEAVLGVFRGLVVVFEGES